MGLRDMHIHFVYGVDDGAQSAEDMYAMLDMAVDNGITTLYATSHRTPGVEDFPEGLYRDHLEEARAYCLERRYDVRLHAGAEVLYTPALRNVVEGGLLPTMGETRCVLLEFVPDVTFREIESAVTLLEEHGYIPVLAHIERYECLYGKKAYQLKREHSVYYQVNCSTVLQVRSLIKRYTIKRWFSKQLIDFVSSDSHDTHMRPNRMRTCYEELSKTVGHSYLNYVMADKDERSPL